MSETIVAVATPVGIGGIGIIRLSGPKAFEIGAKLFKGKNSFIELKPNFLSYGWISYKGEQVDEIMIVKMAAPRSFTREDVVEFHCHGGRVALSRIFELTIELGARVAEPGEFTKRAFLNGRIDLSQAEAVIDLINAKTSESSKTAIKQLEGKLSEKIRDIIKQLVALLAHLEAMVDYPEYDIEELTLGTMLEGIDKIHVLVDELAKGFSKGRILREGMSVAIVGKPNVGKSSLLNRLAGRQRAIVTDIPGTTRDIIDEFVDINGIPIRFIDTAGIRETEDQVEQIGVEMAKKEMHDADLVLLMIDAVSGMDPEDEKLLEKIKDKRKIVVLNKIDLVKDNEFSESISMSLTEDIGVDRLIDAISEMAIPPENDVLVTNARHKQQLDICLDSLNDAKTAIQKQIPVDCIAIDLKNAAEALGAITGESINESVVHEIFSRFCIGK